MLWDGSYCIVQKLSLTASIKPNGKSAVFKLCRLSPFLKDFFPDYLKYLDKFIELKGLKCKHYIGILEEDLLLLYDNNKDVE